MYPYVKAGFGVPYIQVLTLFPAVLNVVSVIRGNIFVICMLAQLHDLHMYRTA